MIMVCPRIALRLLARVDGSGTREELVGDLLEEIGRGRSRWWLWQQLVGLYGLALAAHVRHHARLTPCIVALALVAVLFGGLLVASVGSVVEAWLGFYLVAGTLSLFAHMMSRTQVQVRL
jgi:hypothetical protein